MFFEICSIYAGICAGTTHFVQGLGHGPNPATCMRLTMELSAGTPQCSACITNHSFVNLQGMKFMESKYRRRRTTQVFARSVGS